MSFNLQSDFGDETGFYDAETFYENVENPFEKEENEDSEGAIGVEEQEVGTALSEITNTHVGAWKNNSIYSNSTFENGCFQRFGVSTPFNQNPKPLHGTQETPISSSSASLSTFNNQNAQPFSNDFHRNFKQDMPPLLPTQRPLQHPQPAQHLHLPHQATQNVSQNSRQHSAFIRPYLGMNQASKEPEQPIAKKMRKMESSNKEGSQDEENMNDKVQDAQGEEPGEAIASVNISRVPQNFRTFFSFKKFNKMQSAMYDDIMEGDENVVVTAPTGAGKTVLFELAFIRMIQMNDEAKAVYLAPTKSLCSERYRDWSDRLRKFKIKVLEMTGDSKVITSIEIREASLIVATPEKWDIITRRARQDDPLMSNLRLFLLDEVHSVREEVRGALLEVIIARTKTRLPDVRILAVSATVPNSDDIAEWIGSRQRNSHDNPASRILKPFIFSDEFRPCPLQKFVYGFPCFFRENDHSKFEAKLNEEVPAIIEKHSTGRPTLIFCASRKGTEKLANYLFDECEKRGSIHPSWPQHSCPKSIAFASPDLQKFNQYGIAFHHAGLAIQDRREVERTFLKGDLKILCATTTLSVGVNLPAYLVIIRGTKMWAGEWKEQSDLTILQMMGRAGRPQFDKEGVCVIMTERDRQEYWDNLLKGTSIIESTLHENLLEHINAEISFRGGCQAYNIESWLKGTFLYARMSKNWSHYNIEGCSEAQSSKEIIKKIICDTLETLNKHEMLEKFDVNKPHREFCSSKYGSIMANYAIRFQTMVKLMNLSRGAKMEELITVLSEAEEFESLFLRAGERDLYEKILREDNNIRYPPIRVKTTSEKVSVLLQIAFAGEKFGETFAAEIRSLSINPINELLQVTNVGPRIARAMFSIAIERKDGHMANEASMLFRSLSGCAWDDGAAVLRQVAYLSSAHMKKLIDMGIKDIQSLTRSKRAELTVRGGFSLSQANELLKEAKTIPFLVFDAREVSARSYRNGEVKSTVRIRLNLRHPKDELDGLKLVTTKGRAVSISILVFSSNIEVSVILKDLKRI